MKGITEGTEMNDIIENIGNHIVQHGSHNDRIYLMKFSWQDFPASLDKIEELAIKNRYAKIFAKIPSSAAIPFLKYNYEIESFIPKFYAGKEDCVMVSKFFNEKRKQKPNEELSGFFKLLSNIKNSKKLEYRHPLKYLIRNLGKEDVKDITKIYKKIFKSYPFPIFDNEYILKCMQSNNVLYFGIFDNTKLVGIASAELDLINKNAEMTDFAILPEYRGQNMAFKLLNTMETEMMILNIYTLYTIARLKSPGMNKTFLKTGYKYSGTLINNTNISGEIETMNVFYKHLL